MADVGDKLLASVLQLLEPGEIVEDQNHSLLLAAAVQQGGGVHLQTTIVQSGQSEFVSEHLAFHHRAIDQLLKLVQAQRLHHRPAANVAG